VRQGSTYAWHRWALMAWGGRVDSEKLRKTRGTLGAQGEGDEHRVPLGRAGQPLNLDVDAPSEVSPVEDPEGGSGWALRYLVVALCGAADVRSGVDQGPHFPEEFCREGL
jgi:hypothetical protein